MTFSSSTFVWERMIIPSHSSATLHCDLWDCCSSRFCKDHTSQEDMLRQKWYEVHRQLFT